MASPLTTVRDRRVGGIDPFILLVVSAGGKMLGNLGLFPTASAFSLIEIKDLNVNHAKIMTKNVNHDCRVVYFRYAEAMCVLVRVLFH